MEWSKSDTFNNWKKAFTTNFIWTNGVPYTVSGGICVYLLNPYRNNEPEFLKDHPGDCQFAAWCKVTGPGQSDVVVKRRARSNCGLGKDWEIIPGFQVFPQVDLEYVAGCEWSLTSSRI